MRGIRQRKRLPLVAGERTPAFSPSISTAAKPEERCWLLKELQPTSQPASQPASCSVSRYRSLVIGWIWFNGPRWGNEKANPSLEIKQTHGTHTHLTKAFTVIKYSAGQLPTQPVSPLERLVRNFPAILSARLRWSARPPMQLVTLSHFNQPFLRALDVTWRAVQWKIWINQTQHNAMCMFWL